MTRLLRFVLLSIALSLSGCAAITITKTGEPDHTYYPHYEERKHFFLWGLIGEHSVNTLAICRQRKVIQMQSLFTSYDVLFSTLTLGLYLPRTAKVWCERPEPVE